MATTQTEITFVHHLRQHDVKLLNNLHVQWQDEEFCDLVILAENKALAAHACVLSAFSPKIALLISSHRNKSPEKKSSSYTIAVKFSHEVMEIILSALYTGVFQPPVRLLTDILEAVKWLEISELASALQAYVGDVSLPKSINDESDTQKQNSGDESQLDVENQQALVSACPLEEANLGDFSQLEEGNCEQPSSPSSSLGIAANKPDTETTRRSRRKRKPKIMKFGEDMFVKVPKLDLSNPDSVLKFEVDSSCVVNFGDYFASLEKNEAEEMIGEALGVTGSVVGKTAKKSRKVSPGTAAKQKQLSSTKNKRKKIASSQGSGPLSKKESKPRKNHQGKKEPKAMLSPKSRKELLKTGGQKSLGDEEHNNSGNANEWDSAEDTGDDSVNSTVIEEIDCDDPVKKELDLIFGDVEIIKCKKCFEKFKDVVSYNNHILNHPEFTCQECDLVFYRKFSFTRHMRNRHVGRAHLKCVHCEYVAKNETDLRKHANTEHNDQKPFVCSHEGCGYRSWKYDHITKHMTIHDEEKHFICDKCGQSFSQQAGLNSHLRSCYQLQEFLCDLCGQSFNLSQSMKAHRRAVHYGEKRFKCSVCSHTASDHRNLRRHMRIHENSFPYTCPVCKQQFRHSNSLKAHVASKHKELPEDFHITISSVSETRNRLGGSSYKRVLKNDHINAITSRVDGEKNDRSRKGMRRIKRELISPTQMYQSASLSGDFLIPPEGSHFDGSNSNDLELVIDNGHQIPNLSLSKSLDLSGDLNSDNVDSLKDYSSLLDKNSSGWLYHGFAANTPFGGQYRTSVFPSFSSSGMSQPPMSSTPSSKSKSEMNHPRTFLLNDGASSKTWKNDERTLSKTHPDSVHSLDYRMHGTADYLMSSAQKKKATSGNQFSQQSMSGSPLKITPSNSSLRSPTQGIAGDVGMSPPFGNHPQTYSPEMGSHSEAHRALSSERSSKHWPYSVEPTLRLTHSHHQPQDYQPLMPSPKLLHDSGGTTPDTVQKPYTAVDYSSSPSVFPQATSSSLSMSSDSQFLRLGNPSKTYSSSPKLSSVSETLTSDRSQSGSKSLKLPLKVLIDSQDTAPKNVSENFMPNPNKSNSNVSFQVIATGGKNQSQL